jgi:hypothetical protein
MKRLTLIVLTLLVGALFFSVATAKAYSDANGKDIVANTPDIATPEPTATPTPTCAPSTSPTVVPGSPLTLGNSGIEEFLSQFDLMNVAKLVLIGLAVMWVIIITLYAVRKFVDKNE